MVCEIQLDHVCGKKMRFHVVDTWVGRLQNFKMNTFGRLFRSGVRPFNLRRLLLISFDGIDNCLILTQKLLQKYTNPLEEGTNHQVTHSIFVGGLEHIFHFSIYWESHHPN